MSLQSLIRADASIQDIAAYLDALDHEVRRLEVQSLGGADQARLFSAAGDAPPIDFAFFVPDGVDELREVIHYGRNSLPLFRTFEKRFCRPVGDDKRLFGYNEGPTRSWVGPGYFVAHATDAGDRRGAIVVDYYLVPDAEVAPGWPPVKANHQGLQRLVYHQTRDYMRRVSEHVSIGQAHKQEKKVIGTFVLCRQPL
jgi:hypothetical protein